MFFYIVEYIIGQLETAIIEIINFANTFLLFNKILDKYNILQESISDNISVFKGIEAYIQKEKYSIKLLTIIPVKLRGNRQVEKANRDFKEIIYRLIYKKLYPNIKEIIERIVIFYNEAIGLDRYFFYFFKFGILFL